MDSPVKDVNMHLLAPFSLYLKYFHFDKFGCGWFKSYTFRLIMKTALSNLSVWKNREKNLYKVSHNNQVL